MNIIKNVVLKDCVCLKGVTVFRNREFEGQVLQTIKYGEPGLRTSRRSTIASIETLTNQAHSLAKGIMAAKAAFVILLLTIACHHALARHNGMCLGI